MINEELEYWNDIKDFGSLYMKMELLVGLEPVLFVCVSEDDKKFLIMTYNSSKMTYIMRGITDSELLDMLDQKVTMEETFRRAEKIYKTYQKGDSILAEEFTPELFPAALLPKKGATYNIKSQYILDYKKELQFKEPDKL